MARLMQRDTPRQPRVSMTSFAEFHGAGSGGRLDCIRRQIQMYETDYRASAFYKEFVEAIRAGRYAGTDELTLQRCISQQKIEVRRRNYAELRRHWMELSDLHLPLTVVGSTRWSVPGLTVSINPEFGLVRPDDSVLIVKLWLQKTKPTPDAVRAMLWLMVNHLPQIYVGATPAVLDLRRQDLQILGRRPFRKGYSQLMATEASSMGALWNSLVETA